MAPAFTVCVLTVLFGSLTVGTIIHVYLIDVRNMKERFNKSKAMNLMIWLVIIGLLLNVPMWYLSYQALFLKQ